MPSRRPFLVLLGALVAASLAPVPAHGGFTRKPSEPGQSSDVNRAEARPVVQARCLTCHALDIIREQRLSRAGWVRELEKMIAWGASVTDAEKGAILDELNAPVDPPAASADDAAALLVRRCLVCHDARLIEQQRLTTAGWTREIDKMTGWGANPTALERALLSEYLAARFGPEQ